MTKRAYASEDKKVRRDDILAAARRLFVAGSGELPSAARIAAAAGLAKGTLYIYFRTKEAIYADLLLGGWTELLGELDGAVAIAGGATAKVSAFLQSLIASLDRHPELLRLDALGQSIERNLEPDAFHAFKHALNERLAASGVIVEQALNLPDGRGLQLLMRTYAFTRGLWLAFGDEKRAPFDSDAAPQPEFREVLAEALAEYWRGALTDQAR